MFSSCVIFQPLVSLSLQLSSSLTSFFVSFFSLLFCMFHIFYRNLHVVLQYSLFSSFWSILTVVLFSFLQVSLHYLQSSSQQGRNNVSVFYSHRFLQSSLFPYSNFPWLQLVSFCSFIVSVSTHSVCIHAVCIHTVCTTHLTDFKYQACWLQ